MTSRRRSSEEDEGGLLDPKVGLGDHSVNPASKHESTSIYLEGTASPVGLHGANVSHSVLFGL
jgi:hypothetical protein